jgi:hypothetical protein
VQCIAILGVVKDAEPDTLTGGYDRTIHHDVVIRGEVLSGGGEQIAETVTQRCEHAEVGVPSATAPVVGTLERQVTVVRRADGEVLGPRRARIWIGHHAATLSGAHSGR